MLNSASTMFTLDLFKPALKPGMSDAYYVKVAKIYGTCAGIVAICIAPFVMYANGITTFLNSLSQFVSLPILFTVLAAIVFRRVPKYTPYLITAIHIVSYGIYMIVKPTYEIFGGSGEQIHYLYAMAVLFVVELVIMFILNNKNIGGEEWVAPDAGTVDLTPWKYRHIVCIIGIILACGIYVWLSPLGIAA